MAFACSGGSFCIPASGPAAMASGARIFPPNNVTSKAKKQADTQERDGTKVFPIAASLLLSQQLRVHDSMFRQMPAIGQSTSCCLAAPCVVLATESRIVFSPIGRLVDLSAAKPARRPVEVAYAVRALLSVLAVVRNHGLLRVHQEQLRRFLEH